MEPQERLIEVDLSSGEMVYVRPLSPFALQALQNAARAAFPPPDKEAYKQPLSDVAPNALPGIMMAAEDNPDYQAALRANRADVNGRLIETAIMSGIIIDTPEGREATIARYAERIAQLRAVIPLPDDEWLATAVYGLLSGYEDRGRVASAAINPLTDHEVRFALRSFRHPIQRNRLADDAGQQAAPINAPADRQTIAAENRT